MLKLHLTASIILVAVYLSAQNLIPIENASFEESIAQLGSIDAHIPGWEDCGQNDQTPPDILSELSDFHSVKHSAAHGFNFLMMVTRDDDTQEMICTYLESPIRRDSNYLLSIQLAKPAISIHRDEQLAIQVDYSRGVVLRIYGGNKSCEPYQLLAESPPIEDVDWNEHQFLLIPQRNFEFLFLLAYYSDYAQEPYNGSILLDNIQLQCIGSEHRPMHTVIANDKQFQWHSVLKIDEWIGEVVPEGLQQYPGNDAQVELFQINYKPLIFQYELIQLEQFFTKGGSLQDFIKEKGQENILLLIDALRYVKAHRSALVMEQMLHYFQLLQASAIPKVDAAYEMNKLEQQFAILTNENDFVVKRIRHIMAFRADYLQDIRMAMVDLLGGWDILNLAKKQP